jgi:hypothetical protein
MKCQTRSKDSAFARKELLVIIALLPLLGMLALPALSASRPRCKMVECQNNLRRIGQGFQMWANDNGDLFPWLAFRAQGISPTSVTDFFLVASNEFGSPDILFCPGDGTRFRAVSWERFNTNCLSYFAGLHSDLIASRAWVSGDRNLSGDEYSSCNYFRNAASARISPLTGSSWSAAIHAYSGNFLLSDGSTAAVSNRELPASIESAVEMESNGQMHILKP